MSPVPPAISSYGLIAGRAFALAIITIVNGLGVNLDTKFTRDQQARLSNRSEPPSEFPPPGSSRRAFSFTKDLSSVCVSPNGDPSDRD